jgi:hypothetical protein
VRASSSSQNTDYAEKALLHGLVCYLPLFQDKIGARQRVSRTKDTSFQLQLFPSAVREESLEPAAPPVRRRVGSDSSDAIATGDEARPLDRFPTVLAQQHECVVAILAHHAASRTTERPFRAAQAASDLLRRPPEENTLGACSLDAACVLLRVRLSVLLSAVQFRRRQSGSPMQLSPHAQDFLRL